MSEDYKFLLLDEDDLDEIEEKIEKNDPKKKPDDGPDYIEEEEKDKTDDEDEDDDEEEDKGNGDWDDDDDEEDE